ncbi:hypothetical protein GP486_005419 [Trichoglossum hirsutum]|uniref:Uncharacterized protein n=1 Tax=Trichoglossum hirsutum TaxID=265104 RepID=A0A9P8L9A4_9PEZI|nr:hypothetical protein GP486_005419 [Trichoglossum hirsutum]
MSDDWDERHQLEIAIALSLQQQHGSRSTSPARQVKVIDLCSDEEPEVPKYQGPSKRVEGRQFIELDGQQDANTRCAGNKLRSTPNQNSEERTSGSLSLLPENNLLGKSSRDVRHEPPTKALTFLQSIDRKRMEEERLARKRKAAISPPPRRVKTAKQAEFSDIAIPGSVSRGDIQDPSSSLSSSHSFSFTRGGANLSSCSGTNTFQRTPTPGGLGIQYPKGIIKKTWAWGYQRGGDVKLEEVLQKGDLRTAVLSAFQWDMDWVFSKITRDQTKLIFVMQAKDEETVRQVKSSDRQMVFMIDLPRLTDEGVANIEDLTFFGEELVHFLQAMEIDKTVIKGLLKFDFRETSDLAFVHTM